MKELLAAWAAAKWAREVNRQAVHATGDTASYPVALSTPAVSAEPTIAGNAAATSCQISAGRPANELLIALRPIDVNPTLSIASSGQVVDSTIPAVAADSPIPSNS